ncbi:MAG: DMT family transporter [Candidatus Blackburnbacteria bacterium]|nr:DMT family transporter [Candidatus Blackburnbacteria bacterium]
MNKRLTAYLLLILVAVIWGAALPVIKFTLEGFSPLLFLTYRFGISALISLVLILLFGLEIPRKKQIILLTIGYGFLTSTITLGLLFLGIERTTAVDTTLIAATGPILVTVAGVIFLNEHVTRREKLGIALAFAGVVVTIFEPILKNTDGASGLGGNILIFAAVLTGVASAVMAKVVLRKEVSPAAAVNISFIIGFLTLLPIALFFYPPQVFIEQIRTAPLPYHLGLWYMAIFSGNIAYFFWHKAQKTIEVGEAGLFTYLQPIFAIPLAILWLGETISPAFVVGAVIITIGVLVAEYKKNLFKN